MKDPEEFYVDTFLEELREKREKIEQAKEVERLYMAGMKYGEAMLKVLGIEPQVDAEIQDHMKTFWARKGDN